MYGKEKWFYYFGNDDCDVDCRIVVVDYFAQYSTKRKFLYIKYDTYYWHEIGIK